MPPVFDLALLGNTSNPVRKMQSLSQTNVAASHLRIGVAVSRYHAEVTDSMRHAAIVAFNRCGGSPANLHVFEAAGAFELTALCRAMAQLHTRLGRPALDAIVALGCVISGETAHDQYIAQSITQGLTAITINTGMPIAFGVLTCQSIEQARARSIDAERSGGVNKGEEAMIAAIHTANALRAIASARGLR